MTQMKSALAELEKAQRDATALPPAVIAEQTAYNALLKLAAREHQIVRSRSQQGQQSGQRNQRQLSELEMKPEDERYQTVRDAGQPQEQQNAQQGEQLAVLNRLKELAQRQEDINEQLKELQTALQEAKSEEQKEEIRRQLKRLQEEEQQLLADTDELQQKMTQSENAAQFAEERKQLEQTRERAQEAGESMREESVPKALAAGTRAERELEQLRDDFRKKSSAQFRDDMREMRNNARDLAEAQQALGEKLKEASAARRAEAADAG